MIDYEKLKMAHEICSKLNDHYFSIDFCVNTKSPKYDISITYAKDGISVDVSDIEELITKLQELAKPEQKYKVGDEVIFLHHEGIEKGTVDDVNVYNNCYIYHVVADKEGFQMGEARLFPTRQALIEHQIQYWDSLQECQHEWSGLPTTSEFIPLQYQAKCSKCGEFYK